jgi:hypothetical protein
LNQNLSIRIGFLQVHFRQCRNPLEIRQWRHVHNGKARQLRLGDLDHQNPDRVIGVLRLLHRKANQVVAGNVDIGGRDGVQFAGQITRRDRPVLGLLAQLDADFGALPIDEIGGLPPANQGHVVTGHQQLRSQQGATGCSQHENIAGHVVSSEDD